MALPIRSLDYGKIKQECSRASLVAVIEHRHHHQTVAGQLVNVLEQVGVKQIFGLIGDSLNPLADSVRRAALPRSHEGLEDLILRRPQRGRLEG